MTRFIIIARDPLIAAEAAAALVPAGVAVEHYFGSELSAEEVFAQLSSVDMFEPHKVFIYSDFLDIKLVKATAEKVNATLARLPAELSLICTQVFEDKSKADEDKALKTEDFRRFADGAKLEDLRGLSEARAGQRWLAERALKRYGLALTPAQSERLWMLAAEKPALVDTELRKLGLSRPDELDSAGGAAVGKGWAVPDDVFNANVSATPAAHFYALVDAIMVRAPESQRLLAEWFSLEPETFRLVFELKRKLLGLYTLSRGGQLQPPWLGNQLRPLTRHWPQPRLGRAIRGLAQLEHDLKSGMIPAESSKDAELSALQVYVADLSA